jgi:hypothetical protein
MENFEKKIDNIIGKALNEAFGSRGEELATELLKKALIESAEIEEKLHGKQSKIDVAKPKGKITSADFKKLRDMKEVTFGDTEDDEVEPYGDFKTEKPKVHDMKEGKYKKDKAAAFIDYLKKSMDDIKDRDTFDGRPSRVIGVDSDIDKQRMEEDETMEGNAFSGALAKAKEEGKDTFEVDGKTYNVKESWEGDVEVKQTGEYSDMSIAELNAAIKRLKTQNDKFMEDGKKVPEKNKTKMSQLYFAKRAKQGWKGKGSAKVNEGKKTLRMTESEIIDMIEKIVMEQNSNIQKKSSAVEPGFNKVSSKNKEEGNQHLKDVMKKMKDYLKTGSEGEYEMNPQSFPVGNGEMKEMPKKAYTPSDAVDEYIDAFAYPGMTNLVYDEIKPNDEWIEANIVGSSKTGNAQVDEEGNALGNVVPSKTGEKFYKNYKDNLYGAEQMNASYKRYPQPVDQAGEGTEDGALALKKGAAKAQKVLNQLESKENAKAEKVLKEEFEKMKKIISYNQKTQ